MQHNIAAALVAAAHILIPAAIVGLPTISAQEVAPGGQENPAADARLSPYSADAEHLWNRLHRALFVRAAADGKQHVHSTDPLLYWGGMFLLEGESHRRAIAILDEFLARERERALAEPVAPSKALAEPVAQGELLKRLMLQRDLWAAFDYAAWYPDDWVYKSKYEPAAIVFRTRLAKAVGRLALDERQIAALPDNYALTVKSKQFATSHDPEHPERPFLPADIFDPMGPWVWFHDTSGTGPMAQQHFHRAGGRAVHVIFLRLPEGRAATEQYLKGLKHDSVKQFPPGTMVAMVRRALAVDRSAKLRVTPVTELVQIRVYRRIPEDPRANFRSDFEEQDVYEFVLDRTKLFAGEHGLRSVGPEDPAEPFARGVGDPFAPGARPRAGLDVMPQMKTCIQCHQAPGVHSVTSMERGLRGQGSELFRTYAWNVEVKYTVHAKVLQFNWGLLQGLLEANR